MQFILLTQIKTPNINSEAKKVLDKFVSTQEVEENDKIFRKASEKSGVKIIPSDLRDWFCNKLGRLGVSDRYIDAFCGRVPRSILGRYYTDYNPERLKKIYNNADLKILI